MMTCFFKIDSMWQIFLLILSQLTVFSYVISVVFLYRRGCKPSKLASVVVAFVINTILYASQCLKEHHLQTEKHTHN